MTIMDLAYVAVGFLLGFAAYDIRAYLTRPPSTPKPVVEGWDQVRHVTIIRDTK